MQTVGQTFPRWQPHKMETKCLWNLLQINSWFTILRAVVLCKSGVGVMDLFTTRFNVCAKEYVRQRLSWFMLATLWAPSVTTPQTVSCHSAIKVVAVFLMLTEYICGKCWTPNSSWCPHVTSEAYSILTSSFAFALVWQNLASAYTPPPTAFWVET